MPKTTNTSAGRAGTGSLAAVPRWADVLMGALSFGGSESACNLAPSRATPHHPDEMIRVRGGCSRLAGHGHDAHASSASSSTRSPTGGVGTTTRRARRAEPLTPARVAAAARLVRSGSHDHAQPAAEDRRPGIDVPEPADHHMTMLTDVDIGSGSVRFAKDYVGARLPQRGAQPHRRLLPRGLRRLPLRREAGRLGDRGGRAAGAIDVLKDGLVGRGVLLDVPRAARGPLARAGRARVPRGPRGGGARAGGDASGRATSCSSARATRGARPSSSHGTPRKAKAGLHPTDRRRSWRSGGSPRSGRTATATPLRAPRRGSGSRSTSSRSTRWAIHLLDYLQFEDLVRHCEADGRWEFLFVAAPLRIVGGTGSPAQPDRDLLRTGDHIPETRIPDEGARVVGESRWPMAARGHGGR